MGFPTTLQEFQTTFPDEQACWETLRKVRWPRGFACPRCGHRNVAGRWHTHYLDWAKRWNDVVEGKVGYADTLIQDFYHGSRKSRLYRDRKEILLRQTFDPAEDLSVNSDGCLEWASDKTRLHEDLRLYFRQRTDR